MTAKKRWTNDEEQVIISKVRQYPNNLKRAFKEASEVLDRTEHAVALHWYNKTRMSEAVFITAGSKTANVNSKNVFTGSYDNTQRVKVSIWRKILRLLGL